MLNQIRKRKKTVSKRNKNAKIEEIRENMLGRKSKRLGQTIRLEEINQKVLAKEERLKRYRDTIKQYRRNKTFRNKERNFYQQIGEKGTKTYAQPNLRRTKQFWCKIW